ncbi:MAG: hypothetical protein JNM99_09310 [Verrucomicrobiaceae bacterium]|nr:hypothetical protein [Verrucomicrobiaceae bacterium]
MKSHHFSTLLLAVLALGIQFTLSAAPTIPNPSFELNATPTNVPGYMNGNSPIIGWTTNDPSRVGLNPGTNFTPFGDNGTIPNGARAAFIQSTGFTTTLSTTITGLTAGTWYRVQFRANSRQATSPVGALCKVNGGAALPFTAPAGSYSTISTNFQATSTTAALEITNNTAADSTLLVDDFTISAATPIVVTSNADSGAGSLRAALATAAGTPAFNLITFAPALNAGTIMLTSGEIQLSDAGGVALDASSLSGGLTISGGSGDNRIMNQLAGSTLSLRRLTFTSGDTSAGSGGGAIMNAGTLSVFECVFTGNTAPHNAAGGGAIANTGGLYLYRCLLTNNSAGEGGGAIENIGGRAHLTQCTLTNNSATPLSSALGGAIFNNNAGVLSLEHCTVSGNTASAYGGGISSDIGGHCSLANCIVAGNTATTSAAGRDVDNYGGTVTRVGANLIEALENGNGGTDSGPAAITAAPQLSALASNGGPTPTMAIASTSPARNAAVGSPITSDQRGFPVVGTPDIGAFEVQTGGTFSLDDDIYTAYEGGAAEITIQRSGNATGTCTVRLVTTLGTAGAADFTGRPDTSASDVTFLDGETAKMVRINLLADSATEGDETFTIKLSNPSSGATLAAPTMITGSVTIKDAFVVTNTNDLGPGSLRQALTDAANHAGADAVAFASSLSGQTITFGSEIIVTDTGGVTVDATSVGSMTLSGNNTTRLFRVSSGGVLNLQRLVLTEANGNGTAADGYGGAMLMNSGTVVTATDCVFTANAATFGGAIMNYDTLVATGGTLTLRRCTFFGNTASQRGGAVYSYTPTNGGAIRTHLDHCTLSGNTATADHGGGLLNFNGLTTLIHCTVTSNTAPGGKGSGIASYGDNSTETIVEKSIVAGNTNSDLDFVVAPSNNSFTSAGSNVIGTGNATGDFIQSRDVTSSTPLLAALADNGGPTQTHALLSGSPALDRASGSISTADQRGSAIYGVADSGAFESGAGGRFRFPDYDPNVPEGSSRDIIIVREGDIRGAASVRLVTTPGTATAADFTLRPNTSASDVIFADGEVSKTVTLYTTADPLVEAAQLFTISLTSPSPASRASVPPGNMGAVTIIDPIVVTTTNDDGPGSLRQAFRTAAANSWADRITFAPGLSGQTITLGSELVIDDFVGVTVDASSLPKGLILDGAGYTRILRTVGVTIIDLRHMTFARGRSELDGGAFYLHDGVVSVSYCTFTENSADLRGGGIFNDSAKVTISHCTFWGNSADRQGGAVRNGPTGLMTLRHCTFSANSASSDGRAIFDYNNRMTLDRCVSAGNFGAAGQDIDTREDSIELVGTSIFSTPITGITFTGTGSILMADPLLLPLASNGGPTKTCALSAGSPAMNAGGGSAIKSDQRGFRIVSAPDLGAFETQLGGSFTFSSTGFSTNEGSTATVTIKRLGGSEGTASVRVFTQTGTASAADFTARTDAATSNVLFWEGQDTATISIATTSDSLLEANELFSVKLSLPSPGCTLGAITTATVVIVDASSISGDTKNPALPVITYPTANAEIGVDVGGTIEVSGSASDDKAIGAVLVTPASGPAVLADRVTPKAPTTVWKATFTPVTGLNSFVVSCTDGASHTSPTTAPRFFKVLRPLLVNVSGTGSVTPAGFTPKSYREVGKPYSLTAVSGAGSMFVGWSILSSHTPAQIGVNATDLQLPVITFIHREGLALRAVFAASPYNSQLTGIYNGAITPNATLPTLSALDTEGFATFTLQSNGSFTGNFKLDGGSLPPVNGIFDTAGIARFGPTRSQTFVITRTNKPALTVTLQIDIIPPLDGQITGTLSILDGSNRKCDIVADRAVYSPTNLVPSGFLGANNADAVYSIAFSKGTNAGYTADQYPQGDGVGYYKLTKTGALTLVGTLPDGTTVTNTSTLSGANTWRLFVPLYGNKGLLAGNVAIVTGDAFTDIQGYNSVWICPVLDRQHYPAGWPLGIIVDTVGAKLNVPLSASIVPGLPVGGAATLSISAGLLATSPITRNLTISAADLVTHTAPIDTGFTMKIDRKTGLYSGTFTHSDGTKVSYRGVIVNKNPLNPCIGFFLTTSPAVKTYTGQGGKVSLLR